MALAPRVVPESRLSIARRRYDPLGALSVTGGLVLLVYAISQAPQVGWGAARTVALLAVSAALLWWGSSSSRPGPKRRCSPAPVPLQHCGWSQHRRVPARGELLHVHLRRHPVHAAGARVLGPEDGVAWLTASITSVAFAGLSQMLVTKTSARPSWRSGWGSSEAGWSGPPKCRSTRLLGALGRAVLRDRGRHRLRLHTGVDRSPGRGRRTRCRRRLGPAQHLPATRWGDRCCCRFDRAAGPRAS